MDTPDETSEPTSAPAPGAAGQDDGHHDGSAATRSAARRGLDRRTVAICVCLALVAAIAAGLVASIALGDDADDEPGTASATLLRRGEIDAEALAAVPLRTADGDPTTLAALLDPERPTVVNLWAQSCAPCIKEMPWLEATRAANPDVAFLGVNVLDRIDRAEAMAAKTGITYPWVRDTDGSFGNAAQSSGLPDTLLIEPDGSVVAAKLGAFASQADIQSWLDDHVA